MKRWLSLILACVMVLSCVPAAFAAEEKGLQEARALYELGLFKGTGTDAKGQPVFELDRAPNRLEAVIMLVRLLGKEEEALKVTLRTPFTDVPDWAAPYVGYAYAYGLTSGISVSTFGGTAPVTAAQYLTFVLRALGYDDKAGDFTWDAPWQLADRIGLTGGAYSAQTKRFLRGDAAILAHAALAVKLKGSSQTLRETIPVTAAQGPAASHTMQTEDYFVRKLTDGQLAALQGANLDTLQAQISTLGDAIAFLDQFVDMMWGGANWKDAFRPENDLAYIKDTGNGSANLYTSIIGRLIVDDHPQVRWVVALDPDTYNGLALPVKEGYAIVTPAGYSRYADTPRGFADCTVSELSKLPDVLTSWDLEIGFFPEVYIADPKQEILQFDPQRSGSQAVGQGTVEAIWKLDGQKLVHAEEDARLQQAQRSWANVEKGLKEKTLPAGMGPTLTKAQAEALYGKDLKTVADSVKTLGDVIVYLAAAGFKGSSGDRRYQPDDADYEWHFNYAPQTVLAHNYGNCGGTSGLTAALLEGDYAITGMIGLTGSKEFGGGHVINWLYDGKTYYIFDMNSMGHNNFRFGSLGLCTGSTLQQAADQYLDQMEHYVLMYAYQSFDGDAPVGWDNGRVSRIPDRYKDNAIILAEDPANGYVYQWVTVSQTDWDAINKIRTTPEKVSAPVQAAPSVPAAPVQSTVSAADELWVDPTGALPPEIDPGKLTDSQLAALKGKTPEVAAKTIATLADAYAWLEQEGYKTNGMNLDGAQINSTRREKELDWTAMSATIGLLLEGDYEEVGTLLFAAQPEEQGWPFFYISFNYVKTGGYYYVTDPMDHLDNSGWAVYRAHTIKAKKLEDVRAGLAEFNDNIGGMVTMCAFPLYLKEQIAYEIVETPMAVTFTGIPGLRDLYRMNAQALAEYEKQQQETAAEETKRWNLRARTLRVSDYGMPAAIGNTTLDYNAAFALVGQDPALIAQKVKTVGDVLQYMIASRFGYNGPSAYTPWYDNWGFDAPGDEQLKQNYGCCCGGYANAVSYLLEGDYEKVGTLRWVGGGNHTISWVYTGGKYYVFDFTQYCNGGNYNNYRAPVTVLDDLADYYDHMPDRYPRDEVVILVAFEAGKAMYPSHWNDPPNFPGLTFPTEAKGKILVIYQKYPDKGVFFKDTPGTIPGWDK